MLCNGESRSVKAGAVSWRGICFGDLRSGAVGQNKNSFAVSVKTAIY